MSDWKSRAKAVPDWQKRAAPIDAASTQLPPGDDIESIPAATPVTPVEPQGGPSTGEAALQGFGQGASFGFSDELAGLGAEAAYLGTPFTPAVGPMLSDETAYRLFGTKTAGEHPYARVRDMMRRENAQAQKGHPIAYAGGQLAGAVATPGPKGAGAARLAKQGAMYGALAGAGLSEADLVKGDVGGAATDTAIGAGTGAVLAPTVGSISGRIGRWLQKQSQNNALKALGLRAGISNQLTKRGYESADEARELGKAALDMELIRPGRTAADVAERAGFAKEVQGARISQALSDADATGVPFDANEAAWVASQKAAGSSGLSPTAAREAGRAAALVDDVTALPQSQAGSTFESANRLKSDMYQGINYATDPTLKTQLERRVASGLRESIEDQMSRAAGPDVADELRAANRAYGFLQDIEPLAQDEATRQLGRKTLTSVDIAAILGGGAAGGMYGGAGGGALGAGLVAGQRLLGPRIPSTLAVSQRALAPVVMPAAQKAANYVTQDVTEREQDSIDAFLKGP